MDGSTGPDGGLPLGESSIATRAPARRLPGYRCDLAQEALVCAAGVEIDSDHARDSHARAVSRWRWFAMSRCVGVVSVRRRSDGA